MRTLLIVLIGIALMQLLSAADVATRLPKTAELSGIYITTPSSWWLRIKPQGSALIGFGSSGGDSATTPPTTFVFTNVYSSLSAVVQTNGGISDCFAIVFPKTGEHTSQALYTRDSEVIRPLFETAKKHCAPVDRQRFEELWTKHTPVPKK